MSTTVQGTVHPRFDAVRRTFEENFRRRGEWGASLCVIQDGEVVVDLWGGEADRDTHRPFTPDAIGVVFSSTKGLVATCLLMLHDRGLLDYDAPVSEYWPEFAVGGKQDVTVRTLLEHRAGLVTLDQPLSLDQVLDPAHVAQLAAEQKPDWKPGTAQGYHGVTFGFYVPELFRRVAGESVGTFLKREIAEPLGADVRIGIEPHDLERVVPLYAQRKRDVIFKMLPRAAVSPKVDGRVFRSVLFGRNSVPRRAFSNPADLGLSGIRNFNLPHVQAAELPWANGIASARGLARFYQPLALDGSFEGVRLMSPASAKLPQARSSWQHRDKVLLKPIGFTLGFVKEETHLFSPNEASFGHPGAGGALGWADPTARLSIGYVPNRMDFRIRSKRALALCHAIYRSVGR